MEKVLKWFNYPHAHKYEAGTASLVRPCFVEASSTVEKAISCYKMDRLVGFLLSFRTFSRHLQYANFVLQGKNAANEATDGCSRTFDA